MIWISTLSIYTGRNILQHVCFLFINSWYNIYRDTLLVVLCVEWSKLPEADKELSSLSLQKAGSSLKKDSPDI